MPEPEKEIIVRRMAQNDLDAVLAIEEQSFSRPWTRRHFLDELASSHSLPLVALSASGEMAGYLCLQIVLDEAEILDIAVSPLYRRRGVGRLLVHQALCRCREVAAAFLALEVASGNDPAQALYRALGFREVGRRKRYYHDGEDAVLMERVIEPDDEKACI